MPFVRLLIQQCPIRRVQPKNNSIAVTNNFRVQLAAESKTARFAVAIIATALLHNAAATAAPERQAANKTTPPLGPTSSQSVVLVERSRDSHAHEPHAVLTKSFVPDLLRGHHQMPDAGLANTRCAGEASDKKGKPRLRKREHGMQGTSDTLETVVADTSTE